VKILGINSVYHETAAALVIDGVVVAAAEEERFNRYKHGAPPRIDNAHKLPMMAIDYCLRATGVDASEIDAVCYSFDPAVRREEYRVDPHAPEGDWGHPKAEAVFLSSLAEVEPALCRMVSSHLKGRLHWVPHHLAHAASAYFPSGYSEAGILVADGIGEHAATSLAFAKGNDIEILDRFYFPNSIGFLWEKVSRFLGFTEYDACKVMGLAGYGDPSRYRDLFGTIVQGHSGSYAIDGDIMRFRQPGFDGLVDVLGPLGPGLTQDHMHVAAALQVVTDDLMVSLARRLHQLRPTDALCIAGGVGLNCHSNWLVKENTPYENIFITFAPHDAGTAIGAALYHYNVRCGRSPGGAAGIGRRQPDMGPYVGPAFSDYDVARALASFGIRSRLSAEPEAEAAWALSQGKVVGWFQGQMEFGPRALGNRSLLADPTNACAREILNRRVKHREPFRPFGPSVLEERADEVLDLGKPSESFRYMLFAAPFRDDGAKRYPAVAHVDGTARLQLVSEASNPLYYRLLRAFEELTGAPLVLNTSFNDGEPIVCTPRDALETFCKTGIDVVVLGNHVVER
jgi:carbamoyltransferase